jgi:hypothetical protein
VLGHSEFVIRHSSFVIQDWSSVTGLCIKSLGLVQKAGIRGQGTKKRPELLPDQRGLGGVQLAAR